MTGFSPRVDYNQIAPEFDKRYQVDRLEGVERSLINLAEAEAVILTLEVGCGTGRWLQSLESLSSSVFGLDFSWGMLNQAMKKSEHLHFTCGEAGRLPFGDKTFDFVFCINALHHFDKPRQFLAEVFRVLKSKGLVAIIGQVPQDRKNRWYVYDYFEGTYQTDLLRFQPWGVVLDWMIEMGFENIHWTPIERISDNKVGWAVLQDPFLQKNAVSQLALLSDQAYQIGLQKIKNTIKESDLFGEEIIFKTELRFDQMVASKIVSSQ